MFFMRLRKWNHASLVFILIDAVFLSALQIEKWGSLLFDSLQGIVD